MFSFFKKKQAEEVLVTELKAYISGKVIPIEEVNDGVFSAKVLGDGFAIEPTGCVITAPCDGVISSVMEESKHALGMQLNNGAELLIHEGLDTVDMHAEGFKLHVKEGQKVKAGDKLITFDPECIRKYNHPLTCICVLLNYTEFPNLKIETGMEAVQNETVIVKF